MFPQNLLKQHTSIHIFNPETDYALALGRKRYCPPASIVNMRRNMAFFPGVYAENGDIIATVDDIPLEELRNSDYYHYIAEKNITTGTLREISKLVDSFSGYSFDIKPWGWNHTIRRLLVECGFDDELLKTEEEIDSLRELSHRRTVIGFQNHLQQSLPGIDVPVARIFTDLKDAMDFCKDRDSVYLKMPWSSSGRGVVCTKDMSDEKIREWASGSIRRQGSVMAEEDRGRSADFATEWMCKEGKAIFMGYSFFETTKEGRYKGNSRLSQNNIREKICHVCPEFSDEVLFAQKSALEELIAPFYEGPAGIDMLSTGAGRLNPCVEINLRQTMGMAMLPISKSLGSPLLI